MPLARFAKGSHRLAGAPVDGSNSVSTWQAEAGDVVLVDGRTWQVILCTRMIPVVCSTITACMGK